MDFLTLVKKRKSCRDFSKKEIPLYDIMKCVEAAQYSPSACGLKPWNFYILRESLRDKIAILACEKYEESSFIKKASTIILVTNKQPKHVQHFMVDIGIACEHFVLQATELGIESCYVGYFNNEKVYRCLGLNDVEYGILIALGYKNENPICPPAITPS